MTQTEAARKFNQILSTLADMGYDRVDASINIQMDTYGEALRVSECLTDIDVQNVRSFDGEFRYTVKIKNINLPTA